MRKAAVALLPLVVTGCVVLDLLMLPLKLIFGAVEAVGGAVGGLVASNVTAEPIDGPAPAVSPLPDGRWLVEAPSESARFRVTVAASGHEPATYVWPDDFRGARPGPDGAVRIDCALTERAR